MSLQIDVRDLVARPGAARPVHVAEPVSGLATELAEVPLDRDVDADLLFESVVEGILVSGGVDGQMRLRCARCLREFDAPFDVRVQELFAPGATPRDDDYPLTDGFVDLEPMIRDAVILAMPFAPLCRPDCLGLCERCGGDRNLGECACGPLPDPRWGALTLILDEGPTGAGGTGGTDGDAGREATANDGDERS